MPPHDREAVRPALTSDKASWPVALALFVFTALLFARALGNGFVNYDDPDYVTANPHVQSGLTAANARWAMTASAASNWHPLTWISHQLDVSMFGMAPGGHHLTSVLLHAANAALLFLVLRRLTGAYWRSALVAALFACHPLRVESVAWVAERKDVLSGLAFLVCLWAYAGYVQPSARSAGRRRWYLLSLAACAFGLAAKPMLVTIPGVLLLLDFWPLGRTPLAAAGAAGRGWGLLLLEKLPFVALAIASSGITYVVQKGSGAVTQALTFGQRAANAVVSVPRYVGKFVWPSQLAVLYPHPGDWPVAAVAGAIAFVVAVSALALAWRKRRPWLLVGWLWFLGMLVPVSGLVQVGLQSMADRYTYLPAIGLAMAAVWWAAEWIQGTPLRLRVGLAAATLGAFSVGTVVQLGVWKNSITLFHHTVAVAGVGNYLAHDNLGIALGEAGQVDAAVIEYEHSLAIRPDYANANNNLGRVLADRGRLGEAITHYETALRSSPNLVEVHNNLANALADAGRVDEAIAHYQRVLETEPEHLNARNGYGVALAMKGSTAEAEKEFRQVLRVDPSNASALSNLGNIEAMTGRFDEAAKIYERALAAHPDDARTLYNLGNVLMQSGRPDAAVANYRRALGLAPLNPDAHAMLGLALSRVGQRDAAVRELETALQQRPDFPQARAWLAAVQAGK